MKKSKFSVTNDGKTIKTKYNSNDTSVRNVIPESGQQRAERLLNLHQMHLKHAEKDIDGAILSLAKYLFDEGTKDDLLNTLEALLDQTQTRKARKTWK